MVIFGQKIALGKILALVLKVRNVSAIFETTGEIFVFVRNFIEGQ